MNSVFIGGSRKLYRLDETIRSRLDGYIYEDLTVFVGDANGADKAIQKYLFERGYRNVVVYCMEGSCRNNIGRWRIRSIASQRRKRGWEYYALKDDAMARDASFGFMIWDGKSKGTLNNVVNLLQYGKRTVVYFSPEKRLIEIHTLEDITQLLAACDPETTSTLEERLNLGSRLGALQDVLPFG